MCRHRLSLARGASGRRGVGSVEVGEEGQGVAQGPGSAVAGSIRAA
jgi:hypothetical protein